MAKKASIPSDSVLNTIGMKYDYFDSYQDSINDPENNISPTDITKAFFNGGPKWVGKLLNVRNKIVSVFGLKTSTGYENIENFKCDPGEQMGLFKVFYKTENEVVLGEDDKHLDFKVSLFLESPKNNIAKKSIIITTTVKYNNWFGRLYFMPVRPFHKLIVPTMLKGIIKELEKKNDI